MIKWILTMYVIIAIVVCLICFSGFVHEVKHNKKLDFFEVVSVILTGLLWLPACLYIWASHKNDKLGE